MPAIGDTYAAAIAAVRANRGEAPAQDPGPPPMPLPRTVGARSARRHLVPMRCLPGGDAFYDVASAHGGNRHPDGRHNRSPTRTTASRWGPARRRCGRPNCAAPSATPSSPGTPRVPVFADNARRLARAIPVVRLDRRLVGG